MTDDVISIKEFRQEKEKKAWKETLDELEENMENQAQGIELTPVQEKGYKNFKRFIEKMRETHVEGKEIDE